MITFAQQPQPVGADGYGVLDIVGQLPLPCWATERFRYAEGS